MYPLLGLCPRVWAVLNRDNQPIALFAASFSVTLLAYHEWEALAVKPNIQLILVAMHGVWQVNT